MPGSGERHDTPTKDQPDKDYDESSSVNGGNDEQPELASGEQKKEETTNARLETPGRMTRKNSILDSTDLDKPNSSSVNDVQKASSLDDLIRDSISKQRQKDSKIFSSKDDLNQKVEEIKVRCEEQNPEPDFTQAVVNTFTGNVSTIIDTVTAISTAPALKVAANAAQTGVSPEVAAAGAATAMPVEAATIAAMGLVAVVGLTVLKVNDQRTADLNATRAARTQCELDRIKEFIKSR